MADPFRASPARGTPSGRTSDPVQASPASFRTGDVLGRYRLLTSIGRGGTGEVFQAEDTALGRMVAVKVLSVDRGASHEHRTRFEREARTAAAISHPNVVSVFDVGQQDGVPYLVQELVDGETVSSMLEAAASSRPRPSWPTRSRRPRGSGPRMRWASSTGTSSRAT